MLHGFTCFLQSLKSVTCICILAFISGKTKPFKGSHKKFQLQFTMCVCHGHRKRVEEGALEQSYTFCPT